MTAPAKPKVLHVYRGTVTGNLSVSEKRLAKRDLGYREYLGEYVPRGPVVSERWEVRREGMDSGPDYPSRVDALDARRKFWNEQKLCCRPLSRYRIVHITMRKVSR